EKVMLKSAAPECPAPRRKGSRASDRLRAEIGGAEVLSRGVKPMLGLLVLLAWPCLGWGSRAEAGFALGKLALPSQRAAGSSGPELRLVLKGEEAADPDAAHASPGMGKETPPFSPGDPPRIPPPP